MNIGTRHSNEQLNDHADVYRAAHTHTHAHVIVRFEVCRLPLPSAPWVHVRRQAQNNATNNNKTDSNAPAMSSIASAICYNSLQLQIYLILPPTFFFASLWALTMPSLFTCWIVSKASELSAYLRVSCGGVICGDMDSEIGRKAKPIKPTRAMPIGDAAINVHWHFKLRRVHNIHMACNWANR